MANFDPAKYEKVKGAGQLPSPKGAALNIIRLTQKNDVTLLELERVIRTDPAFVGRLIKAANLVNGPAARAIVSVREALMILGISSVRNLSLGFSLISNFQQGRCRHFDFPAFWSHSLVTALAFQAINQHTRAAQLDEAFSIGLLCRVGELALAILYPEQYDELLTRAQNERNQSLIALERSVFLLNHAELSSALLHEWGIPQIYVDAVFFHDQSEMSPFPEGSRSYVLCHALALARHIADICLSPATERKAKLPQLYRMGAWLSIDAGTLNELCDQVTAAWPEWAEMLNLKSIPLPSFGTLASQAPDGVMDGAEKRKPLRLLIVEDDKSSRLLLKAIIENDGHQVLLAADGEEGFAIAIEQRPDIVITDWMMAGMNGLELTRALRKTKDGRGIYIILLTTKENEDDLVQAFEAGADDFISKPLRPKTISARLTAGQRMIALQRDNERDQAELRRFAEELSLANRRLHEMAMTDALTGFPNLRYAMDRLDQEWSLAKRSGRSLSCMILDSDDFKPINDTLGHDVGDLVLQRISSAIHSAIRAPDVICRLGGDEFIVICPDTSLEAALVCAERVRQRVAALSGTIESVNRTISVSIGVAVREQDMAEPKDLLKRADEGAYQAKQEGRNRVATVQPRPQALP
ncbi:hypothetical protein B9N43_02035 [Denitratisoma sp. DHT3]|uniref:diguanylate cyclase n=1 Tax=Denitratisoma sp. DHT3 TaxID=1981880 RepID=UPI00119850F6|nr:diguanylate cyclase [Denitratisoma sp. DHT3]QDX82801.1 hypothetical protein B9N43_02035 [Denitratisoma sp. DHT3]